MCNCCGPQSMDSENCAKEQGTDESVIRSTSPGVALRTSESSVSNASDISVDVNSYRRGSMEERSTDSSQDDTGASPSDNSFLDEGSETYSFNKEIDEEFWLPPEPKDEDDGIASVVNCDDDDDEDDDWGESASLRSFEDVGSASFKAKEEKKKTLEKLMNGKFKTFVGQLLKSVGVVESEKEGESWINIVASLSWQAASYIKPSYYKLKAVDPNGYVKIKCVATGSCTKSRVIRGLVFKKHAAHKRMPTKYEHPKILLIQDPPGLSLSGLSSMESIEQEEASQNKIVGMIEKNPPNVILVEKTVSRKIQEAILAKGMTLVLNMKLHRLERIARCTGSTIVSSDSPTTRNLMQCESFYFEKFVEEHAPVDEGGKRPSKTLMFLEGCPTRRGCSILLMGANSDVLKRVKYVVRGAVVMAYHIMLETSFLLDQRAMFSTIALPSQQLKTVGSGKVNVSSDLSSDLATTFASSIDIKIPDGDHVESFRSVPEDNSSFSFEPSYNSLMVSGFPGSIGEKILDHDTLDAENEVQIYRSLQSEYFNNDEPKFLSTGEETLDAEHSNPSVITGNILEIQNSSNDTPDREIPVVEDEGHIEGRHDEEPNLLSNDEKVSNIEQPPLDTQNGSNMDDIGPMLDSEGILVLVSTRNASRGSMCEHRHFSRIKFYQNFDVPLGKFLRDDLLNQRLPCKTCSDLPEAHIFYYAHHNEQLTIQVRRLPKEKYLPGETEGKLWMWSRCGKCKFHNGSVKCTKRVLISSAAGGLSFGKFLELGFSHNSSFGPSLCGHMFHKDFLHFFGFGPMVAMFKYSTVATYSVSLPPQKLDFRSILKGDSLKKDFEDVLSIGIEVFKDIENSLDNMSPKFENVNLKIEGSSKEFSDIKEMLNQERCQFEVELQNAVQDENPDKTVYSFLSLNRARLVLLIESYVWDRRLHALFSCDVSKTKDEAIDVREGKTHSDGGAEVMDGEVLDDTSHVDIDMDQGSKSDVTIYSHSRSESCPDESSLIGTQLQKEEAVPLASDAILRALSLSNVSKGPSSSLYTKLENEKGPIWSPFSEILNHCMHDILENIRRDTFPRFSSVLFFPRESMGHRIITDEGSKLHVPLATDYYYILSDYENEVSSIIACALAKDRLKDENTENSPMLPRFFSFSSSHWSSSSSLDTYNHGSSNMHLEELRQTGLDGRIDVGEKYSVNCLYASQFRELRSRCCPSEADYIASLSRCKSWDAKGGKSKSLFAKTLDDRFIIKEIKRAEFDSFVKFAPKYFAYMNQCHERKDQTCLAKTFGIYQVVARQTRGRKETRHDLMVMENLSFGRNFTRSYDLKGALHARLTTSENGSGDVLLDQNFVNDMNSSPLYVSTQSKRRLQRGYWNDTIFLKSIQVMDYSLLVGVDSERQELVCGIIDYLRQYTWDKQLETWVKSSLVPKNLLPTIISPEEYYRRFRKFIDTNFVSVPDDWCFQRSKHCELCGPEDKSSEHSSSNEPREEDTIDGANGTSPEEGEHEDDLEGTGNGTSMG